ncbi:hypothetical protein NUKP104_40540 [Klebsiella variicola]|nr:hypothetical protein NUKP104_40540 [Klebsiella variicola]VEC95062.1 Gifsy-2 prophage protein [Klebsiella variicola]
MYGRFSQSHTREEYLAYLAEEAERDIAYDSEPLGPYNVVDPPYSTSTTSSSWAIHCLS